MAYAQATLTSANASHDFAAVLDGLLIAAGWSVVETLTVGGTVQNKIYKSAGASNLCGYDWYLAVCSTNTGSANYLEVWASEAYNSGTHIMSSICGGPQAPGVPLGSSIAGSTFSNTVNGDASGATLNMSTKSLSPVRTSITTYSFGTNTANTVPGFSTLLPSSAFAYWMSVSLDRVGLFTSLASGAVAQHAVYSTVAFDSVYKADARFKDTSIVCWQDFNSSTASAGFLISSGLIAASAPSSGNYTGSHFNFSQPFGSKLPILADTFDVAYAWAPHIYVDAINGGGVPPFPGTVFSGGIHAGAVPDFYLVYGGSVGDTVTVGGATFVLCPLLAQSGTDPITLALPTV